MIKRIAVLLATLATLSMTGCATTGDDGPQSDRAIASDVRERLEADAVTARLNIGISVTDGVVTLSGRVIDPGVRLRAKAAARGTEGVKGVVDNLGSD